MMTLEAVKQLDSARARPYNLSHTPHKELVMARRPLYTRTVIILILILQVIPLLLFPPRIYGTGSQQLWLPALLVLFVVAADARLILGRTRSVGAWYLRAFAQGFNVISRLLMVWPNGSTVNGDVVTMNWDYLLLSIVAIALSTWLLVYMEKPQVREALQPA
jgi:hypothetical protein